MFHLIGEAQFRTMKPLANLVSTPRGPMTPDPASEASANPLNPQSFDRYGYVLGNPARNFDPYGLQCEGGMASFAPQIPEALQVNVSEPCPSSGVSSLLQLVWAASAASVAAATALMGNYMTSVSNYEAFGGAGPNGVYGSAPPTPTSVPWAGSITGSFPVAPPVIGAGLTVVGAYNPSQGQVCVGGGIAATIPGILGAKSANFGPLLFGNQGNASETLSGWSVSFGVQLSPGIGYQYIANSSGVLSGPTVVVPGASVSVTYSKCNP